MCLPIISEKNSLFFQKLLDIMEDKVIVVMESHSITGEAFENLGEESIPENAPKAMHSFFHKYGMILTIKLA